ncbi:MFS transporter [Paenibacillus sp. J23TS9]|uniref:MFS transporter n=1 Tax=Paenibacillus sp. J23TS9 TaxID=2807193 RepID=UPI001BCFC183|nr:MFS transporter [Paenibacillus sp. J23TS9]
MEKVKYGNLYKTNSSNDRNEQNNRNGKSKVGFLLYLAIASVPIVFVLGNSMLVPILPQMKNELHISRLQSSLVITVFSLLAGIFIPVAGFLSDRFSRKAVMIPALIIYGSAGILAGFGATWHSYTVIIIARAIQGIGAAGTGAVTMALVGDLYNGATESKVLGVTEAANGTGKVLSPVIGTLFALITWFTPFFAFPVFCLMSLLCVIFIIKEPHKTKEPPKLKKYLSDTGSILKEKGRWLFPAFFSGALALFNLFGVLFYLSDTLEEAPYNIDGVKKGLILAIPLLGMVITSYTTGALIKKNGTLMRWLINIGFIILAGSLTCCIFLHTKLIIFIVLLTIGAIGTGLILPCLNTMITGTVQKEERGMITSIYNSLRSIGVAFGPPLFGYLMKVSNQLVFIVVASLAVVALLLVFFMIKPKGQLKSAKN